MIHIKRDIRDIQRFRHIVSVLVKHGFGYYMNQIDVKEKLGFKTIKTKKPTKSEFPKKLKSAFEELGGAFIKLGQLFSLRPDLIPKEICEEFRSMQDSVPAFEYKEVKKILKTELKKNAFLDFEKKPIAAASIGQVHIASLKSGKKVVVKVQRPNIRNQIESDIDILYFIAKLIEKYFDPKLIKPTVIVKEFEEYTQKELDYQHEARNIEVIRKNFEGTKTKIPKVYWDYSTKKVLVLEYIRGEKLSDAKKLKDPHIVSKNICNAMYKQLFIDGVFHADPHPGNIIIMKSNNIAFIDFGIVGYITENIKEKITDMFIAAVDKDISGIADSMVQLGVVKRSVNREELKQDIIENFSEYYNMSLKEISISEIFHKVIYITKKHKIKLPKNFVLLSKSAITTESVVQGIDPKFNPVEEARPFVKKLIERRYDPARLLKKLRSNMIKITNFATKIPDISEEVIDGIYKGDRAIKMIHKDINQMTSEMDKSSNRIAIALIITALIIGSSFMVQVHQRLVWGIPIISFIGFVTALILCIFLLISMWREKT